MSERTSPRFFAKTAVIVVLTLTGIVPASAASTDHWFKSMAAAVDLKDDALEQADFSDIAGSVFESAITWLAEQDITTGCNPPANTRFCPDDPVTRGEMAVFISRAIGLPAPVDDHFVDDPGLFYEAAANRLFGAGITAGCNPPTNNRFCGEDRITREQMAAFLVRAFGLPLTYLDFFDDDDSSLFETAINRIAVAGITQGCNPPDNDLFCPREFVTRGQMAAFFKRALTTEPLPGPTGPIIYQHGVVEASGLAMIRPDGTGLAFLQTGLGLAGCPAWSPDRSRIAFSRIITVGAFTTDKQVVVADSNGGNPRVLTHGDGCPTWSPDGKRIAYSGEGGFPGIWVIDVSGANKTKVNDSAALPAWSPNGGLLAVVGEGRVYTQPLPGESAIGEDLVDGGANPDWHPDGSKLVIDMQVNGVSQVFAVNSDGSGLTQLTNGGILTGGAQPAWSPNGRKIVFTSDRDGDPDLYIMDADGSNVVQLTKTAEDEFPEAPDW